jgi:uncharacterized membrane protein
MNWENSNPEKSTRLTVVDVLRGYFLFAIVINHIRLFPNLFVFITGGTSLWLSFASGFFFISGFILSYLYRLKETSEVGVYRNSLAIFIVHSLILVPLPAIVKYWPNNFLANSLISFGVLMIIDRLIIWKNKYLPSKSIFD